MIRVCVSGARGRMGRLLTELIAQADDLTLSAALERADHPELGVAVGAGVSLAADPGPAIAAAEVLLDFSLPAAVCAHVAIAAAAGRPVVTGTTGLSPAELEGLNQAALRIPLVCSSNMSRGVHALLSLVRELAAALPEHDAEIFEIHHRHKPDAPSGTALLLARAVQEAPGRGALTVGRSRKRARGEVGIAACRGGDVVGEHQVMFLGAGEQIILTHRATSREHFCQGALDAVRFVSKARPGLYSMSDVFGGV